MKDVTGNKYGRLTAICPVMDLPAKNGCGKIWKWQCDCGNIIEAGLYSVERGGVKSCGCLKLEHANNVALSLEGQRFGKLTVIEKTPERKFGYVVWKCKCDCGNEIFTTTQLLMSGNKTHCGCVTTRRLKSNTEQKRKQQEKRKMQYGNNKSIIIKKETVICDESTCVVKK